MKFIFALFVFFSVSSFARPYNCKAVYDMNGMVMSFDATGDLDQGHKISMFLQGYKFEMGRFTDDKGFSLISIAVIPDEGDETQVVYPNDSSIIDIGVTKPNKVKYRFTCTPKA